MSRDRIKNRQSNRYRVPCLIAVIIVIILVVFLVAALILPGLGNSSGGGTGGTGGGNSLDRTRTAIVQANSTTENLIRATNLQRTASAGATQTAILFTATPTTTHTATASPTADPILTDLMPDFTATAEADLTFTAEVNTTAIASTMVGNLPTMTQSADELAQLTAINRYGVG